MGTEFEHGEASSVAEELMVKGGPESEEREWQSLISVVAVVTSESVGCNQLIKRELLEMKNGEM